LVLVDLFQLRGSILLVAGVGITLTRASRVVFAELDWVPGNISQCEDRCHRIGQSDTVHCLHIVVNGSVDGMLAEAIVRKQEVITQALDNDEVTEADMLDPTFRLRTRRAAPRLGC